MLDIDEMWQDEIHELLHKVSIIKLVTSYNLEMQVEGDPIAVPLII